MSSKRSWEVEEMKSDTNNWKDLPSEGAFA